MNNAAYLEKLNPFYPIGIEDYFDVESWCYGPDIIFNLTLKDKIKYKYPREFVESLDTIGYELPDYTVEEIQELGFDNYAEECSYGLAKDLLKILEKKMDIRELIRFNQMVVQNLSDIKQHMAYATARIEAAIHSVDYTEEEMYQDECDLMMDQNMIEEEYEGYHDDPYEPYGLSEPYGFIMH